MKKYSCILILPVLIACSNVNPLEKRVLDRIKNCGDTCVVKLNDETEFEWDTVYVFDVPLSSIEMEKIMGLAYPQYREFSSSIIFIKDAKIVYHETKHVNVEGITDNEIIFGTAVDTTRYKVFTPAKAIFNVTQKQSGNKHYFELIPIE
jgi:hypothetical protein